MINKLYDQIYCIIFQLSTLYVSQYRHCHKIKDNTNN